MDKTSLNKRKKKKEGDLIRYRIASILFFNGPTYGYEISKIYNKIFAPITLRNIYYHLKKGLALGMFKIKEAKSEQGQYSWGDTTEKVY